MKITSSAKQEKIRLNRNNIRTVSAALRAVLLFLILLSIILALAPQRDFESYPKKEAAVISRVTVTTNGKTKDMQLPCTIRTKKSRTRVTVTFQVPKRAEARDMLYVKTVYCPLTVSLNDRILAQLGDLNYYPSFMHDPATEVRFVALPNDADERTVTLTYLSPEGRDYVALHAPIIGKVGPVTSVLRQDRQFPFALALLQIFIGVIVMIVTASALRREPDIRAVFWLGLFSLCAGIWELGENNLTLLLFDKPALLYILDFMGLECLLIPFIRFLRCILDLTRARLIVLLDCLAVAAPIVSLTLQLAGTVPLYQSIRFFHIFTPLVFLYILFHSLREYRRKRDSNSLHIVFSLLILFTSATLEAMNYYLRLLWQNALFFEVGMTIFILYSGYLSVRYFYLTNRQKKRMETDMRMMTIEAREQKKHSLLIMENERKTRALRHDMRQSLIAIKSLAEQNNTDELNRYIDSIIDCIPSAIRTYCDNPMINAIVSYYASACEQQGIRFETHLSISADDTLTQIRDVDLCAVFGNLLENALEACERMEDGSRFVTLNSICHLNTLTIVMDNSYDGKAERSGELFRSSKRDNADVGIGLSSIRGIARIYGGDARFDTDGTVFRSSVYMYLQ